MMRLKAAVKARWATVAALFCAFGVAAQEVFDEVAPEAVESISLSEIIRGGDWPMNIIIGLSFAGVFLLFLFLFTMRAGVLYPKTFLQEAEDAAEEGDLEALREICRENRSPAARIVGAAVEYLVGDPQTDYMVVRDAMEDEGARQAGILLQRIQYLMDVAIIAPMVGLLGTVWGMMLSFSGLKAGISIVNKADALAAGVSTAMYTTFAGLCVGIVAMIVYAVFRGRVNNLIGGLENACNRVLRRCVLSRRPGKY